MHFPVSGVETALWVPPLTAFCVSFFTSMGGVSGAFLLLPFQVSALGYTAPSVSATNHVFNVTAIPSGVYRYIREGRMVWPLTLAVIIGTLPGVFLGALVRIRYLPDPKNFKLFAGCVLLYIGARLVADTVKKSKEAVPSKEAGPKTGPMVTKTRFSLSRAEYAFAGRTYSFPVPGVLVLCFFVGIAGGIYGIGGGAIVAPFFVAVFGLPVYTVAGAALMGTFITSVAGVAFYHALAPLYPDMAVTPDWALGLLFGLGGMAGMYLGARCQRFVPARVIKAILSVCLVFVAGKYIIGFF